MICKTCKHATWAYTPTGQIKKKVPGKCAAPVVASAPFCVEIKVYRKAIWPDMHDDCQLYEKAAA